MKLTLKRYEISDDGTATISHLNTDDGYTCYTLEDTVREVTIDRSGLNPAQLARWVSTWKIAGRTAIPTGTYQIVIDRSPLFSKRATVRFWREVKEQVNIDIWTPHILNVPGFEGIRIHSGSIPDDTEGCVCPGRSHKSGDALVTDSRLAMGDLMPRFEKALGLERIPAPDSRIEGFLRYWAFGYKNVAKPEGIEITITNEFNTHGPSPVDGMDT
jgi:hypothetical protein